MRDYGYRPIKRANTIPVYSGSKEWPAVVALAVTGVISYIALACM